MDEAEIAWVRQLAQERAGIRLDGASRALLETRLAPIARREGLANVGDLIAVMQARREERLYVSVMDALLSRETAFFHDRRLFDLLRKRVLPEVAARRAGRLIRVWSAGAATCQEPYSVALMLDEGSDCVGGAPVEIIASDASETCVELARAGAYSQYDVQRGLSVRQLLEYFSREDDRWRLKPEIRERVVFRRHNLLEKASFTGSVDVVLCCNVLSQLDAQAAGAVLLNIASRLAPDGWLLVAAGEERLAAGAHFETAGQSFLLRPGVVAGAPVA